MPSGTEDEQLVFGPGTVIVRASAETTGGALTIIEEVPPLLDTPLHVHSKEDELFYILEGEHIVQRGDEEFRIGPGTRSSCHGACRTLNGAWSRARAGTWRSALPPGSRSSSATSRRRTRRAASVQTPTPRRPRGPGLRGCRRRPRRDRLHAVA